MRPFLLLILALFMASCAGQWGGRPCPPLADLGPVQQAALPVDLPRSVSETGEGSCGGDIILMSEGVTEITNYPSRFRLQCGATGNPQWVVGRIEGLKPANGKLRYTFAAADTVHELTGAVFTGIAAFNLDTWRFQDVSMIGWYEPYFDSHYVAINIPPDVNPVGADGCLYFAAIVCGEWAEASTSRSCSVHWEYDEPFLAAPVLSGNIEIDGGPDWDSPQCGGLAVYRCLGAWDPEQAEIVDGWYSGWVPELWSDPHSVSSLRSYAAALRVSPDQATPPLSEFSNVLTFGEE